MLRVKERPTKIIKNIIKYILHFFHIIFLKIIPCIASLVFMIVPFLEELLPSRISHWIWFPALFIYLADSIYEQKINSKGNGNKKLMAILQRGSELIAISFFGSVYLINFFDTPYSWPWAIAVISAVILTITLLNIRKLNEYKNNFSPDQIKISKIDTAKQIVFYLLADTFYISIILDSLIWQFISGGLCMLIIYANLTEVLLSNRIRHMFHLIHDLVLGVALTIYLIYVIPDQSVQNIVLVVVSALYGGIMTLVGVAWTIKDGQRRETEAKRLETIPYLQVEFGEWKVEKGRKRDAPVILSIMQHTGVEMTVVGGYNMKIKNIGLGLATNLKCRWESGAVRDNYDLSSSVLQCNKSLESNVSFDAVQDHNHKGRKQARFVFEFDDLLGNHYEQCLQVWFDIQETTIIIPFHQVHAPKFLNNSLGSKIPNQ